MTADNLDQVRRNKNKLVRLTTRVETVRLRWAPVVTSACLGAQTWCVSSVPWLEPVCNVCVRHQAREVLEKFLNDHDDMHDFNLTANLDRERALQEERDRLQEAVTAAGELSKVQARGVRHGAPPATWLGGKCCCFEGIGWSSSAQTLACAAR